MENINGVGEDEVSVIFPPSPSTSFDLAGSFRQQHQHPRNSGSRYHHYHQGHGHGNGLGGTTGRFGVGLKSNLNKTREDNESLEEESGWEQRPQKFPAKDEGDVILRKVRSVLNKISSVNYTKLRNRWINLIPKNSAQLMEVVRLVVGKSIDEPMFMPIYARLLGTALGKQPTDTANMLRTYLIAHIHSLLKRCATDMELAKFDRSVQLENSARHKKVMLHRFIAHLFLEDVCSSKFVTEKITDLIGVGRRYPQDADEPLECLCVLLTFAGAKLEKLKGQWLGVVLQKINLEQAACSPCVSKRIQFMVLDLLEMKSTGWTPHGKWWTPSVHLDADDEEYSSSSPEDSLESSDSAVEIVNPVLEWRVRNTIIVPPSSGTTTTKSVLASSGTGGGNSGKKIGSSNPILGLLNKVVPANIDGIANDLKAVLPKTIGGLNESIDIILTHVINEPYYTQLHAMFLAKVNEKIPYFGKLFNDKLRELIKSKPEVVGISCFLGEWYNLDMIPVSELIQIVDECLIRRAPWIESLCAFFLCSGRKLNSNNVGKLWMSGIIGKLQLEAPSCHEYRLACFVMDIVDLHNNNWESVRSLNWITQFKCTDEVPAQELEFIVELLDRNHKAGLQAMKVAFGKQEGSVDSFIFRSILWAIQNGNIAMMKVTGRCIRKLLSDKGKFAPEKFHGVISRFDLLRAITTITTQQQQPDAWNHFGIIMSELYSSR